jgi:hypothetical protein
LRSTRLRAVALVSALVLAAPAWCAAADASAPAADERARFKAAKELLDKGNFAAALPLFRAIAGPNARLYVARCLVELKQLPEAYDELSATVREASERAASEPRYAATRDAASNERTALAAQVGLVVVAVSDRPAGLEVKVAGRLVPAERLGEAVAVAPGPVLVEATAPGRVAFEHRIAVGAGASELLAIPLPPLHVSDATTSQGGLRTAGVVVAGVGVAGFATFAVTGLLAGSKYASVYKACGGVRCVEDARHRGEHRPGRRHRRDRRRYADDPPRRPAPAPGERHRLAHRSARPRQRPLLIAATPSLPQW